MPGERNDLHSGSARLITRTGERIAIVGRYEDEAVASSGVWPQIVTYVQGIRDPLRTVLERLDPKTIAINHSMNDVKADGLTHGMHSLLMQHLDGSPWADRLISAENVIGALRGRKTDSEVDRIRAAIATTDEIFAAVAEFAQPGRTERQIASFMHEQARSRGVETAWEAGMCPIVTTGPDSMVGHGLPSESLSITPGNVFHIDFGVQQDGYCSDIQRAWYVPKGSETAPPRALKDAAEAIVQAIATAAAALKPGAECWTVDDAARRSLVSSGYPEYHHATGHHVGRAAHDGAGVLGPKWERYGRAPFYRVEAGNVFAIELGIENADGRGYLGLEEMVLVTDDGCRWLTVPQTTLPLLE